MKLLKTIFSLIGLTIFCATGYTQTTPGTVPSPTVVIPDKAAEVLDIENYKNEWDQIKTDLIDTYKALYATGDQKKLISSLIRIKSTDDLPIVAQVAIATSKFNSECSSDIVTSGIKQQIQNQGIASLIKWEKSRFKIIAGNTGCTLNIPYLKVSEDSALFFAKVPQHLKRVAEWNSEIALQFKQIWNSIKDEVQL